MAQEGEAEAQEKPAADARQVMLQKIYVRDASVEVPGAPEIFTREWQPQADVQLNTAVKGLSSDTHEVVLSVTLTAKLEDEIAYLVEVEQAGVFKLIGFKQGQEREHVLGSYCASVLYPYVRETVGDLVLRAGFPQFLLQPVNFDALYHRHRAQRAEAAAAAEKTTKH